MKNVGQLDKTARVIIGLVIGVLGVAFQSWWGLIGLLPFLTGLMGWCPLYTLLKISSNKVAGKTAGS